MYLKPLKIGKVTLENNIILAPMAGITDLPFRKICKQMGIGLVCSEMVSAKAIYYGDEKTKKLCKIQEEKRPISVQIFGSDIPSLKMAAQYVSTFADILDINMGCPAPKVVKNGDGSKLLLNLDLVEEIVSEVVKSSTIPVTVKTRKGWDKKHIVDVEVAKRIEKAGASAITIHGRTTDEYYTGHADWDSIKQVKENSSIPVIGNGDIVTPQDAEEMIKKTGVDGIMIGRATLGNPWILREIKAYLETGEIIEKPTWEEKKEILLQHLDLEIAERGEKSAVLEMRKHIAWYVKGQSNATKIKQELSQIQSRKDVEIAIGTGDFGKNKKSRCMNI